MHLTSCDSLELTRNRSARERNVSGPKTPPSRPPRKSLTVGGTGGAVKEEPVTPRTHNKRQVSCPNGPDFFLITIWCPK